MRSRAAAWTPYGGWLRFPPDVPAGYGLSRRSLDPIVRELALETPGVEYFPGQTVVRLLGERRPDRGRRDPKPRTIARRAFRARLTVAADGRDSTLARLARVPARLRPHNRFTYFAYWHGARSPTSEARLWMLDPDAARRLSQRGRPHGDRSWSPTARGCPSSVPIPRPPTREWSARFPTVPSSPPPSAHRS